LGFWAEGSRKDHSPIQDPFCRQDLNPSENTESNFKSHKSEIHANWIIYRYLKGFYGIREDGQELSVPIFWDKDFW
jgi:hypothetical protein